VFRSALLEEILLALSVAGFLFPSERGKVKIYFLFSERVKEICFAYFK
jgi:hypothetical protein